ncbi:MAG TPA: hypothetical protein VIQ03_13080 [Gammaproteobacteria bacterium]
MNDLSYSTMVRNLSRDYYNQIISKEDYRNQRRILLDKIDEEYNGRKIIKPEQEDNENDQSFFMKTVAFFKNKDLDQ